jgi:hypothetical protein
MGSTQPLTEMITRNLIRSKGRPARKADNLTVICEPIVSKMWESRRLTTLLAFTACYRDSFTFFYMYSTYDYFVLLLNTLEVNWWHIQREFTQIYLQLFMKM